MLKINFKIINNKLKINTKKLEKIIFNYITFFNFNIILVHKTSFVSILTFIYKKILILS